MKNNLMNGLILCDKEAVENADNVLYVAKKNGESYLEK